MRVLIIGVVLIILGGMGYIYYLLCRHKAQELTEIMMYADPQNQTGEEVGF